MPIVGASSVSHPTSTAARLFRLVEPQQHVREAEDRAAGLPPVRRIVFGSA